MTTITKQPRLGEPVLYCTDDASLGCSMNAAIITYVYRSGFNHEPVEGWLVDLAVLSRNGVLNVSKVEFCPFQNYGRWSWLDAERKEEDAE